MQGAKALVAFLFLLPAAAQTFSGAQALAYTKQAVSFGPRPPNSEAIRRLEAFIVAEVRKHGWETLPGGFTASTPLGPLKMSNIIARRKGSSGKAVVFSGHYDTKLMPGIRFVGANDGGSSTGFLLEMARALASKPLKHDVYLVWFDGEEAIGEWSSTDGLHGSRHLAERWAREGFLPGIAALINVDMIGDANLGILREAGSARSLQNLVWDTAHSLGYRAEFQPDAYFIEDDHAPFVRQGVNAIDLIDFDYGPNNRYWHTEHDTVDKLSAKSFEAVGRTLLAVLAALERR
jgi:glutaminyl-peptide cyclotransferase